MAEYRLYIDESGDHTFKNVKDLSRRYLGLTGVLIRQSYYNAEIPDALESLKKKHFRYDPDKPPILVRRDLIARRGPFGVLRESAKNDAWEADLLSFLASLQAQIFTVVIDKQELFTKYVHEWNPYDYSLMVLLNRIKGYLRLRSANADIMPEARGTVEDNELSATYMNLRTDGDQWSTGADYGVSFPEERLLFRRKEHNVAGLQIADLIAAEQKMLTITERNKPLSAPVGPFGNKVNQVINGKVNRFGRTMLP